MNFPDTKPLNVSNNSRLSWLARNRGKWIGLLMVSLLTFSIVGAYAKSNGISLLPRRSNKVVATEKIAPPSSSVGRTAVRQVTPQAGTLLISEFRLRGPNGANDEFIEIYNNSGAPHTVAALSGTGYGVAASDGVLRCTIPNGTVIPTNGHFLCTNSVGYSYSNYPAGNGTTATGDATYATDIADNAGIALFNNNTGGGSFSLANRFDAVGSSTEADTTYKEGTGYPALTPFSIEYSFTRLAAGLTVTNPPFGGSPSSGLVQDTDNNAADFIFVDTNGTSAGAGQRLGAPGPKNLSSPIFNGVSTPHVALDTCSTFGTAPNKVRDLTSVPAQNSTFGTIDIRRTFTNNTGAPLTRLRIRLQNIATFPAASGIADLRPRTSSDVVVTVDRPPCGAGTSNITVFGTDLEQDNTAPSTGQPNGGGFNSTMSPPSITLGTPLANGASIDLHFLFGIQQTGSYKIAAIAEGLPTAGDLWILTGNTEDASDFEGSATPPVIAQQGPLTRQQASAAINSTIATVSDSNPGTLTVTTTSVPAGITVSNIVNNSGTVTADVSASCAAALGANTVGLRVTNGTTSQFADANLTVNVTANTAPTLTYSNPPGIVFGQPTTVNPSTGPTDNGPAPTLTVQSTGTFTGLASVNGAGVVSISNSAPVGTHTITIRATDSCGATTDAPFQLTIAKAQTNTQVSTTLNPSVYGQTVTFNVTVAAVPPGAGTPTGTVQFQDGGVNFGAPVTLVAGGGSMTLSSLGAGVHLITAVYSGDANFLTSTSLGATQTVQKANTTASNIISSVNPSVFGQPVTFSTTISVVSPGPGSTVPTGTVNFFSNGSPIGSGTINGAGVASVTTTTPPLGVSTQQITAIYGGDTNYNGSSTAIFLQTVNKANANASTPTSTVNPSVFGQSTLLSTTLTAVAPGVGTPSGSVTFLDGATPIGTTLIVGGVANFLSNGLTAGSHTITAQYSGDQDFNPTTSAALTQVVNKASTTVTVASLTNPTAFGQSATFTANVKAVAPGAGTPTGTVTFFDGANPIGTGNVNGSGIAQVSTTTLTVGTHNITATYNGDANFLTSTGALPGVQTVVKANTLTTPSSAPNPSVFGQPVVLTATVTAVAPGAGLPTGTVTFLDSLTPIGTGSLNGSGVATFTTSALAVGSHSITMNYGGDGNFNFSFSTAITQVVNKASTTTSVTSSVNPSLFGQATVFTATVAAVAPGAGTPSGTVTFLDGAATLGTGTLSGGVATLSVNTLSVGSHSITVTYSGDSSFLASTSAVLTQVVNKAPTNTALTSSVNPSVFGQAVTFTATVTSAAPPIAPPSSIPASRTRTLTTRTVTARANGATTNANGIGTPTGTVTFFDGATQIGNPVTLNGSAVATLTIGPALPLSVGTHPITAVYSGDGNFLTSTSPVVNQVVNPSNSNLSNVTSNANPSVFGQPVTFSTTATAATPGGGTPTGTVTFFDNAVAIGTGTLTGGVATFTTSSLSVGTHPITASYGGDGNFNPSATVGTLTQTVNKAATATVITTSTPLAVVGGTVTYTATINPVAPGAGVPTGTVQFRDNGVNIGGPVTLVAGKASVTESGLTFGLHTITAVYSGDGNFLASTGTLAGGQNVGLQFIDPVNGNKLIIDVVNSKYTFITGAGVTIVNNASVVLQFATAGTRVLRFTSANPIVAEVLIDESAPGTLQGKFYVPSTGQDFVMNITSGVKFTP